MNKAIIFDFDGTLADTLPLVFHCFQTILGKYGTPEHQHLSNDDVLKMFGPTEIEILHKELAPDVTPQAIEEFLALYERDHARYVKPYPEIQKMLELLQQQGFKMGVFTGKGRPTYEISMKQLGLTHFFEISVTGDDVRRQKPDAEGLLSCLSSLGVAPENAVMVGDSNGDIAAARDAGVRSVAVNWLSTSQTREFTVEPTLMTNSVQEFIKWVTALQNV